MKITALFAVALAALVTASPVAEPKVEDRGKQRFLDH
jgi:hypothetical protein